MSSFGVTPDEKTEPDDLAVLPIQHAADWMLAALKEGVSSA